MACSQDNFIPMVFSSGTVLRLSSTGYIRRHLTLGSIEIAEGELLFEGGLAFRFLDSSTIRSTERFVSSSMIASLSLKLNPSPSSVSYTSFWSTITRRWLCSGVSLFSSFSCGRWFSSGRWQGWAKLRAFNEGLLMPRVARAMERLCCPPS